MIDRPSRSGHPSIAAALSFAFPGLGQAYRGLHRFAIFFAVPMLVLVLGALAAYLIFGRETRNALLSSRGLAAVLVVDAAVMGWRVVSIVHAAIARVAPADATSADPSEPGPHGPGRARRTWRLAVVGVLVLATVAMHAWAGLVVVRLDSTLGHVFSGGGPRDPQNEQGDGGPPLNQPDYHWDGTARINFLLLGIDAGPGREESLTDTILAVSVDPVTNTAVMISVPRDTGYLPLPDRSVYADGLYPRKINQLATDASLAPETWCPDMDPGEAEACGLRTLERSISLYLGIPIQYYAQVDLFGFSRMIDAVGGLTLCLPGRMVDRTYNSLASPERGVILPAGCNHYDGAMALAYARVRKGYIEMPDGTREFQNDFMRAARQQKVLLELRKELAKMDLIFELPDMLDAIGSTVQTDFPRDQAGDLATLLPLITGDDIDRVVLDYPDFVDPPLEPNVNYLLIPRRDDIRAEMQRLFGADALEGWYVGDTVDGPPS